MGVQRQHALRRSFDAECEQEFCRLSAVLRTDPVRLLQGVFGALAEILQAADWRRSDIQARLED